MNESQVLDIVERFVGQNQPANYQLNVKRQGIRRDGDWWYVVVLPSQDDASSYEYGTILSNIEDQIEKQEHTKVLLVPVLPD